MVKPDCRYLMMMIMIANEMTLGLASAVVVEPNVLPRSRGCTLGVNRFTDKASGIGCDDCGDAISRSSALVDNGRSA